MKRNRLNKSSLSYQRKKDIILRRIKNEFLLINLANAKLYALTESGWRILKFIRRGRKFSEIIQHIKEMFVINNEHKLISDIKNFLKIMVKEGIVKEIKWM